MTTRFPDHSVDAQFPSRWSPRSFAADALSEAQVMSLLEAARWAPSAFNAQPWRFVYAHRGTADFDRLLDLLVPFNQMWAKNASVLTFIISDRFRRAEGQPPAPIYSHTFDAGAAWAYLALQASRSGWATHGMAGFDVARAYEVLELAEADYRIEAAIAVGRQADPATLEEVFRAREVPSPRNPVSAFAFEGRFKP